MWHILILGCALVLSAGLATLSRAGSPLGDIVTDYCGTYEAVGITNPAKWLECRKEWERLKAVENQQRFEQWRQEEARRRFEEQQARERLLQEKERRRLLELEERRVRALEEAAQAQRDAARAQEGMSQGINRPPACTTYRVAPGVIRTVCQ